jgi:hypothetical protein
MAEVEFKLGAKLDMLNKSEMRETLAAWWAEIARGVRFRRFNGQATVAGGVWDMGTRVGPREDFVWAVTRIAVTGGGLVLGTDTWQVAVNEAQPGSIVGTGFTRNAPFDVPTLILNGGDLLRVNGVGTGAGTDVAVSGAAIEVPTQLSWQLL